MKTELEFLCPAKDLETGMAAINFGADAVYIGASKFGARASAGNSVSDIKKLCDFAHLFHAKVYVTINTILFEDELPEAKKTIFEVYEAGADAIIIQDLGILEMELPPIEIFASTQMHNYNLERIQFLEKTGISRIILARELSIGQIKEIRENTSVGLEAFIHGALCVCFSGQCYFSASISGRSANRGECIQACRMPFSLVDRNGKTIVKNKHLLSLKDFNASKQLSELIQAGITSFKIEGRLKDHAYIINNTAYYRGLIDRFIENHPGYKKSSSGKTSLSFEPDPEKTFNRGYTTYFLEDRKRDMASFNTPKSIGKYLGKVVSLQLNSIEIDSEVVINTGDGLCFFDAHGDLCGFNVNRVEKNRIFLDKHIDINLGTELYRNHDRLFIKEIEASNDKRKIDVFITITEAPNGFILAAEDEDKHQYEIYFPQAKEPAKDSQKSMNTIGEQLSKAGSTYFNVTGLDIKMSSIYFIPIAVLNKFRRELLLGLENTRRQAYQRKSRIKTAKQEGFYKKTIDFAENISNSLSEQFYKNNGAESTPPGFELLGKEERKDKPLMTTRYCIKYELGMCPSKQGYNEKLDEPLYLLDLQRKYKLNFDCKKCLMNVYHS